MITEWLSENEELLCKERKWDEGMNKEYANKRRNKETDDN